MQRSFIALSVVALLLTSAFVSPVAASNASEPIEEPALHVQLEENGDATVSFVSVYDLTDEDERDAFETLREDETTQTELLDRFVDRLDAVATEMDDDVDRELAVSGDSVDVRTSETHGIVSLSVEWSGLAAVEDDTLVLTEPFASGFEADRPLVITVPDETTLESVTPEPTTHDDGQLRWDDGADLNGFEMSVSSSTAESNEASDGVPGFSVGATAVALAIALVSFVVVRH